MEANNKGVQQLIQFWKGLSAKQRYLLLGVAGLTIAMLSVFVHQAAAPEYKVLFNGLGPGDVQSITSQLTAKNIRFQLDPAGTTISVPAEQIDSARLEVASQGMPHSGRLGFELFDKVPWGQTEFDEKVNYQRALEGELERTIQGLHDVEAARVHLVLPSPSVFIERERGAKASVILKLRRGTLSPEAQTSIARLVSGAVDELSPENVAVINADTSRPIAMSRQDGSQSGGLDEQLRQRLLSALAPVVGPDHVRASVNVELDPSTLEETQERYDPASSVTLSMQRSEERIGGGGISGVPGTSSNVPGAKPGAPIATNDEGTQQSRSETAAYGVNKTVRRTSEPAGRIRRITAALILDDVRTKQTNGGTVTVHKWSPEELKQVQELAQATLGLDQARGDIISVQNLSFEQTTEPALNSPSRLMRVRTALHDWSYLVRYAVILLLFTVTYWILIRPVKRQLMAAFKLSASPRAASAELAAPLLEAAAEAMAAPLAESSQKTKLLKKQVLDKVKIEPASSSRLVQAWLRED